MAYSPIHPPIDPATVTAYPIQPAGYPDAILRKIQLWNDAILAYRLRYEPVYADPTDHPRSYQDVATMLARLTGKPAVARQTIESMCRWVADQIMIETIATMPAPDPD